MKNEYKDYLKGERNKGKERGKIKQGRDRRGKKGREMGGERGQGNRFSLDTFEGP